MPKVTKVIIELRADELRFVVNEAKYALRDPDKQLQFLVRECIRRERKANSFAWMAKCPKCDGTGYVLPELVDVDENKPLTPP